MCACMWMSGCERARACDDLLQVLFRERFWPRVQSIERPIKIGSSARRLTQKNLLRFVIDYLVERMRERENARACLRMEVAISCNFQTRVVYSRTFS